MNALTKQLADALRAVTGTPPRADYSGKPDPFGVYAALAAFDAGQAEPATGEHTPEPWQALPTVNEYWRSVVPQGSRENSIEEVCKARQADARRIVACVNACAGIPTEQLESGTAPGRARLVVTMDGGLIHHIASDVPGVAVLVVDYDTDGADESELYSVAQLEPDGSATRYERAYLHSHTAEVAPALIDTRFAEVAA